MWSIAADLCVMCVLQPNNVSQFAGDALDGRRVAQQVRLAVLEALRGGLTLQVLRNISSNVAR